jgi:hypothetical protein
MRIAMNIYGTGAMKGLWYRRKGDDVIKLML